MLGGTYLAYIAISLGLTVWVGRTLNRNGKVFLAERYEPALNEAISSMLLVGFYLINIGFIAYTLKITGEGPQTWAEAIEFTAFKVGSISIVLGIMHFALMYALHNYSGIVKRAVKPVAVAEG